VNDLRIAIRAMRATPVVTLVVIVSLALGIGANTAMFSIVNTLLLRALPVERADRLVLLLSNPSVIQNSPWSNPAWEEIRAIYDRRRDAGGFLRHRRRQQG
jgi:putative ABC transport system permease protein